MTSLKIKIYCSITNSDINQYILTNNNFIDTHIYFKNILSYDNIDYSYTYMNNKYIVQDEHTFQKYIDDAFIFKNANDGLELLLMINKITYKRKATDIFIPKVRCPPLSIFSQNISFNTPLLDTPLLSTPVVNNISIDSSKIRILYSPTSTNTNKFLFYDSSPTLHKKCVYKNRDIISIYHDYPAIIYNSNDIDKFILNKGFYRYTQTTEKICKYDTLCTNNFCKFKHTTFHSSLCINYSNCSDKMCLYSHRLHVNSLCNKRNCKDQFCIKKHKI